MLKKIFLILSLIFFASSPFAVASDTKAPDTNPQNTGTSDNNTPAEGQDTNTTDPSEPSKKPTEGKIIGGIAITVNGDPITLYEIQQTEQKLKLDKQKAIDVLIADRIKSQEIKRLNIHVDDARIESEIKNIAKQNHMDYDDFISALMKQGISYGKYKDELKEQIQTQELLRSVLLSNVNTAGETEMRNYYNKHKEEFSIPKEVETIRYVSKDPEALKKATENPMMKIPNVDSGEEKISLESLNPQVAQVFIQTKTQSFTPILNAGEGSYVSFFIKDKTGTTQVPFQQAKNFIAQKLVEGNQDRILDEYFEKIRVKAKINVIRE